MPDRAYVEFAPTLGPGARVPPAARLVRDVVARTEVPVEEEDGDGATERERGNGGRDPECERVRAEVLRDDVRR